MRCEKEEEITEQTPAESHVRIFDENLPAEHGTSLPASASVPKRPAGNVGWSLSYFLFHLKVGIVQGAPYC